MKKPTGWLILLIYAANLCSPVISSYYQSIIHSFSCFWQEQKLQNTETTLHIKLSQSEFERIKNKHNEVSFENNLYDIRSKAIEKDSVTLVLEKDETETDCLQICSKIFAGLKDKKPIPHSSSPRKWLKIHLSELNICSNEPVKIKSNKSFGVVDEKLFFTYFKAADHPPQFS